MNASRKNNIFDRKNNSLVIQKRGTTCFDGEGNLRHREILQVIYGSIRFFGYNYDMQYSTRCTRFNNENTLIVWGELENT